MIMKDADKHMLKRLVERRVFMGWGIKATVAFIENNYGFKPQTIKNYFKALSK